MTHVHSWKIDTPNGPTVLGRCQTCPAEKVYSSAELAPRRLTQAGKATPWAPSSDTEEFKRRTGFRPLPASGPREKQYWYGESL